MTWRSGICARLCAWTIVAAAATLFCLPGGAVLVDSFKQVWDVAVSVAVEAILAVVCAMVVSRGLFSRRVVFRSVAWAIALMGQATLANALSPGKTIAWQLTWLGAGAVMGAVIGAWLAPRQAGAGAFGGGNTEGYSPEPEPDAAPPPERPLMDQRVLMAWGSVVCVLLVLLVRDRYHVAWQESVSATVARSEGNILYDDYGVPTLGFHWFERFPEKTARKCLRCVELGPAAGDEELAELVEMGLGSLPGLSDLRLRHSRVTDDGLAVVTPMAQLEWLSLGPATTDAGLGHLRGLTGLKWLDLTDTQVSGEGLLQPGPLPALFLLNLTRTKITNDDLPCLKQFPRLGCLDLSGTAVTDEGLVHLKELPSVYTLHLSDTRVTDAGMASLKDVPRLQWLFLHRTRVTQAGLAELWAAKPGLRVFR